MEGENNTHKTTTIQYAEVTEVPENSYLIYSDDGGDGSQKKISVQKISASSDENSDTSESDSDSVDNFGSETDSNSQLTKSDEDDPIWVGDNEEIEYSETDFESTDTDDKIVKSVVKKLGRKKNRQEDNDEYRNNEPQLIENITNGKASISHSMEGFPELILLKCEHVIEINKRQFYDLVVQKATEFVEKNSNLKQKLLNPKLVKKQKMSRNQKFNKTLQLLNKQQLKTRKLLKALNKISENEIDINN